MTKISVYLHDNIIDVLSYFGELNDVVNRLLTDRIVLTKALTEGVQNAPGKAGARRLEFTINREWLDELYPLRLRSLLYWFVENEIYETCDWSPDSHAIDKKKQSILKHIGKIGCELNKLNKLTHGEFTDLIRLFNERRESYEK